MKKLIIPAQEIIIGDFVGEIERPPVDFAYLKMLHRESSKSIVTQVGSFEGSPWIKLDSPPCGKTKYGIWKYSSGNYRLPSWCENYPLGDKIIIYRR